MPIVLHPLDEGLLAIVMGHESESLHDFHTMKVSRRGDLLQAERRPTRAPENPGSTWFTDNEKGSGFLGSIEGLSAEEASRPFSPSDKGSAASHAGHILYALSLANRALRGEDAYANSDWSGSWKKNKVDAAEWKELLAGLRREYLGKIHSPGNH